MVIDEDVIEVDELLVVIDADERVDVVVVVGCWEVKMLVVVWLADVDEVVVEDVIGIVLLEVTLVPED